MQQSTPFNSILKGMDKPPGALTDMVIFASPLTGSYSQRKDNLIAGNRQVLED